MEAVRTTVRGVVWGLLALATVGYIYFGVAALVVVW